MPSSADPRDAAFGLGCSCRKFARCLACILRDGLTRATGCTCDPRFRDVAHDIDCPIHGIAAELEPREQAA